MPTKRLWVFPLVFVIVLVPVLVAALVIYQPGKAADCECSGQTVAYAPHSHGVGLVKAIEDDMQVIFNVSPAAQLYQVVDGALEACGGDVSEPDLKHVTVDVYDARLALGERLPVSADLTIRRAADGATVVEAGAPAMYAPGHGYHFGDNFRLPPGAAYDWTVVISPVEVLRQEGAQDLWLEPVEWSGSFTLDADGQVVEKSAGLQTVGQFTASGLHVLLSTEPARALYTVTGGATAVQAPPVESQYFVVDVTDHMINYEEKIPGARVTVTFRQGDTVLSVPFGPVISPVYGYHYGANVALGPGTWDVTIEVGGLDFLRHAGAAVSLPRGSIEGTLAFEVTG